MVALKAVLLLIVVVAGIEMSRRRALWLARLEVGGLALALAAGATLAAIPAPPTPGQPGLPLLRMVALAGTAVPVTVVPQRPGWNLVHAAGADGSASAVGLDRTHLTPMAPRPGATGGWALVRLPAGRSTLWVERGGAVEALRLDTTDRPGDPALRQPGRPRVRQRRARGAARQFRNRAGPLPGRRPVRPRRHRTARAGRLPRRTPRPGPRCRE
ncbi:MAG TPA: hypothetical protein VIY28_19105 [Pseudonocardiaceae bacterium]